MMREYLKDHVIVFDTPDCEDEHNVNASIA